MTFNKLNNVHISVFRRDNACLQMLGLYLYTLIIGHKSCNMYVVY